MNTSQIIQHSDDTQQTLDALFGSFGRKVKGYFLGPVSPDSLIKSLQTEGTPTDSIPSILPPVPDGEVDAMTLSSRLITLVSRHAPSFQAVDTHATIDPIRGLRGPCISLYKTSPLDPVSGLDYTQMELFIVVTDSEDEDPFSDNGSTNERVEYPFESTARSSNTLRGKMTYCAGAMFSLQHRVSLFSIVIFGQYARLLMWDPTGILVTEKFNHLKTDILSKFLRYFSETSDLKRGHDTSVEQVENEWPTNLARPTILEELRDKNTHTSDPEQPGVSQHRYFCIMKICGRQNQSQEFDLLFSFPPRYQERTTTDCGTKVTYAYDITLERVVFVKEYWRVLESHGQPKEGDIYHRLEVKGVRGIPVFGKGNDVKDGVTKLDLDHDLSSTQTCHRTRPMPKRQLYRMSLETICEPISRAQSTGELVTILRDAMRAHDDAFFHAGVLHRSISSQDIMIDKHSRKGVLVDWQRCAVFDSESPRFPHIDRSGVWEFMSARLLKWPDIGHTIRDDRESALWVLIDNALLGKKRDVKIDDKTINNLFGGTFYLADGVRRGGNAKWEFLFQTFRSHVQGLGDDEQTLRRLIVDLQTALRPRGPHLGSPFQRPESGESKEVLRGKLPVDEKGHLVQIFDKALTIDGERS